MVRRKQIWVLCRRLAKSLGWLSPIYRRCNTMRWWWNLWYDETLRILVLCFWRRYAWISTLRDTYNALVSAQKYVNAEAQNTIAHSKMMINRLEASALAYFCAKTSALYVSRSVDIQGYLLQKQRTSIHGDPYLWILISHLQRWSMVDYVFTAQNLKVTSTVGIRKLFW